jgi:DNA-binding CsgD family transcriptional regulator
MLCLLDTEMSAETPMIRLTPRGKEVFQLIMKGLTIRQIGELLGISYSGVLRQREKMLLQNNCTSMLELLAKYRGKLDAGTNDPSC